MAKFSFEEKTVLVHRLSFSPDGKLLAVGGSGKLIVVFDLQAGKKAFTIPQEEARVYSLTFSPDGQYLVWGYDKEIRFWDLTRKQVTDTLRQPGEWISSMHFSPDGKHLATNGSPDKVVRVWDWKRADLRIFTGHALGPDRVRFSPDGKLLAASGIRTMVIVWDFKTGERKFTIGGRGYPGRARDLAFSPDGSMLAASVVTSKGTIERFWHVKVFNSHDGEELFSLPIKKDRVSNIDFHPQAPVLAVGTCQGTVIFIDCRRKKVIKEFKAAQGRVMIRFSPDGAYLACSHQNVILWAVTLE